MNTKTVNSCAIRQEIEALADAHRAKASEFGRRATEITAQSIEQSQLADALLRLAQRLPEFSPDRNTDYVRDILAAGFRKALDHLEDGRQPLTGEQLARDLGIDMDTPATGADPNAQER